MPQTGKRPPTNFSDDLVVQPEKNLCSITERESMEDFSLGGCLQGARPLSKSGRIEADRLLGFPPTTLSARAAAIYLHT